MSDTGAPKKATVFIVDDDDAVRDSLGLLLKTVGIHAESFASGDHFLNAYSPDWQGCVLLDIRMPGTSGMEVQQQLEKLACTMPIIFMTGHGDVPMAVNAMHRGAFEFLQKPYRDQDLLDTINAALLRQEQQRDDDEYQRIIRQCCETLTPRELEVMKHVVSGAANKVIAIDLNLSQRTVEVHRARVMEKMQARSLADLVKMSVALNRQSDKYFP